MSISSGGSSQSIAGCHILALDSSTCSEYLEWLSGSFGKPDGALGIELAVGHFDDGVTWGRYEEKANIWFLGCDCVPAVSPRVRGETLQELRLFGEQREVFIWRTSQGLRGRAAVDSPRGANACRPDEPLRMSQERRMLRGDRVIATFEDAGFTHVADQTGVQQLLPLRVTDEELRTRNVRLLVRHYFEREPETGVVRVALTRLVGIRGGNHGG